MTIEISDIKDGDIDDLRNLLDDVILNLLDQVGDIKDPFDYITLKMRLISLVFKIHIKISLAKQEKVLKASDSLYINSEVEEFESKLKEIQEDQEN